MNQEKFLENISALKEISDSTGGEITMEDIKREFNDMPLEDGQLDMIMEYFRKKNEEPQQVTISREKAEQIEKEDARFLKEYLGDLKQTYGFDKLLYEMSDDERTNFITEFESDVSGLSSMLLVLDVAMQFKGRAIALADLVQEGNLCMLEKFSECKEKGSGEAAYNLALNIIKDRISQVVMQQQSITSDEQKVLAKVNRVQETADRLFEELGRKVTLKEIAEQLAWTEEELRELSGYTSDNFKHIIYENKKNDDEEY